MNPLPRLLFNAFVGLFALEGLVQLAAVFVEPMLGLSIGLRGLLMVSLPLLLFIWVGLARLPWRLLLPVALIAWQTGGMMPVPAVLLDLTRTSLVGGLAQLVVAVLLMWPAPGRFPLRDEDLAEGPEVRVGVTVARMGALVLLVTAGGVFQLRAMAWSLDHITDGYVRVDGAGLEVAHRACTKGDRSVHLVGAIHVGEAEGYKTLLATVPDEALLLAEGVDDEDGLLGKSFGYGKVAERLGLVPQRGEGDEAGSEGEGRFRVRRADVDVNTFDEATLSLLRDVGQILGADDPIAAYFTSVTKSAAVSEATLRTVIADVLTKRNAHLLGVLDEVLVDEPVVVIPWGAMHLREVGRAVEERGFLCGEPRYVRMITWSTVRRALAKPSSAEGATAPESSPASR